MSQRLNNAQELAKRLRKIEKFYIPSTSPVTDPLTAAIAKDDTDIEVTTLGDYATNADIIIVGTGGMELNRCATVPGSGTTVPVVRPLSLPQDVGAIVYRATKKDLGYIEDAGGTFQTSSAKTGIGAANAGGAIAYIDADTPEQAFSFGVRESSLRNILSAFGIDEDLIDGAGASDADPFRALITPDNIGQQSNFCLRASGILVSGKYLYCDMWNCFPEVNVSTPFIGKGAPPVWTIGVKFTHSLWYTLTTPL